MVALDGVVVGSLSPDVTMSDTQGFGLLGTASADGYFPAESGWEKDVPTRILAGLETVAHT